MTIIISIIDVHAHACLLSESWQSLTIAPLPLQRVGGRSLVLSSDAYARLLNQVPSVPVASPAAAAPMYPIPDEVSPQAGRQHHSPPAIFPLAPAQMLGQPGPEMPSWLDHQDPMPSHKPMVVHHTPMDSQPIAPFTATAAPHTPHHPCPQQIPHHSPPQFTRSAVVPGTARFASPNDIDPVTISWPSDSRLTDLLHGGRPLPPYTPTVQPEAPSGLSPAALQQGPSFGFSQQYQAQQAPNPPPHMMSFGSQASMNTSFPRDTPPAVIPLAHGPAGEVSQRGSAITLDPEGGGYLAQEFMRQRLGQSGQGFQQAPHGYEIWQIPQGRAQQPQGYRGLPLGGQQPLQGMEEVSQGFRRPLQGSEQVAQGHEQQGCRELPQGGELTPQGLSEDRVIPGRLMFAQMHSQSCSRVHPRSFARTPSFTDEQSTVHFSIIPKAVATNML